MKLWVSFAKDTVQNWIFSYILIWNNRQRYNELCIKLLHNHKLQSVQFYCSSNEFMNTILDHKTISKLWRSVMCTSATNSENFVLYHFKSWNRWIPDIISIISETINEILSMMSMIISTTNKSRKYFFNVPAQKGIEIYFRLLIFLSKNKRMSE